MNIPPRCRHTGLTMARGSTDPGDLERPAHRDLGDSAPVLPDDRPGPAKVWARNRVIQAPQMATASLVTPVDAPLGPVTALALGVRDAIVFTLSYLLRRRDRPTPFGLLSASATAGIWDTAVLRPVLRHLAPAGAR